MPSGQAIHPEAEAGQTVDRGQSGQTAVEYALLLAGFGLPMIFVFRWLLGALSSYYGMVTFLETLPLP